MADIIPFPERMPADQWVGDFSVYRRADGTYYAMLAGLAAVECETDEAPRERGIRLSEALASAAASNIEAMKASGYRGPRRGGQWAGTILQVAGAAMVASNLVHPYWGYLTMYPGAILHLAIAVRGKEWPLAFLMGVFCLLNLLGIWRWMA